jgi:hypothetical protein
MADWKHDGNYEVTINFWQAFIKCNPLLREKKCVRFNLKRDDFCTIPHFSRMYDDVYAMFVMANVAIKLDKEEWFDRENNMQTEEEAFDRKPDIQVTMPYAPCYS